MLLCVCEQNELTRTRTHKTAVRADEAATDCRSSTVGGLGRQRSPRPETGQSPAHYDCSV